MSSSKLSAMSSASENIDISSDEADGVFLESNSPSQEPMLGLSRFLAPDQYLASILREHTVRSLRPPFLSSYSCYMNMEEEDSLGKEQSSEKLHKPSANSLRVPNLLKSFRRKMCEDCVFFEDSQMSDDTSKALPDEEAVQAKSVSFDGVFSEHSCETSMEKIALDCQSSPEAVKSEVFMSDMNAGDLTTLLSKESLVKYVQKFRDQEVDLEAFSCMTDDDLHEIGIESLSSREKLMDIIVKLQNE